MNKTQPLPTDALAPCPFCGAAATGYAIEAHEHSGPLQALVPDLPDHPGSYVIEGDCACGSGLIGATQAEVTERWNRRTPAPVGVEPVAWAFQHDDGTWHDPSLTEHSAGMKGLAPADQVIAMGRVPPNWPTNEMIEAGRKAAISHGPLLGGGQSLWHVFRDMLAAAPSPQKQGGQHGAE